MKSLLWSAAIALSWGATTPVLAAERLTLRFGPFEQSVDVADLDSFARTGKVSASMAPFAPLLTPQVQQLLNKHLQIDPKSADKFVNDLLRSADGNLLLKQVSLAIPNSTLDQVRSALGLAIRQGNGLSAISFLRSYPTENVTVDLKSALTVGLQINAPYLQSKAVASLLERDLTVDNNGFQPSFDPAAPAKKDVHKYTITLQDAQRNRTLPMDIYWDENTTGPLVVISPGLGAGKGFLAYLARHLASHGLTVVALEHPDANISGGSTLRYLLPASDFIERPKDISFVLDRLAQMNQEPGLLQGRLNTKQVTVIGHSLGGYTALAVAGGEVNLDELRQFCNQQNLFNKSGADWLECAASNLPDRHLQLRDKRVVQAIALNPVAGHLFGKHGLAKVKIPTLIWTSTDDALAPSLSQQLRPFNELGGSKYLVTAIGGTHLSVGDPESVNSELPQSSLVPEIVGKNAYPAQQLLRGVSLAFIEQLTPEAKTYEQFLTPAYAQSVSTPRLALRMSTQLPPSINDFIEPQS